MIFAILRLLVYITAFATVLYSIVTVSKAPGNGSRYGLQLLTCPLLIYAGILVVATTAKICAIDSELTQWLFTISASVTIASQLLLWRWWKGLSK